MKTLSFAALLAILTCTVSCKKSFFEPEPADTPEAVFETLWQTFERDYGPFADRKVDWQAVYQQYRPLVDAHTSDDSLFHILSGMLGTLNDGHVNLFAPGRVAFNSNQIRNAQIDAELFDLPLIKQVYLHDNFETDAQDGFVMGLLENDIAYVHLPFVSGNMTALERALDKYPQAKGIIVDLRHNDGGDFTWAFSAMGRFVPERRMVFRSRTKTGAGPADFSAWHDWYLEPKAPHSNKPIVLLTDRYTISAGERAVMAFQTLENCVTLGDTTCGAQSTMVAGELANGWKYTIATQQTLLADGKTYEGIGLAPDVYLKNDLQVLKNGRDQVLDAAIDRLK